MYFADNHVNGMLWGRMQESVDLVSGITTYRIPGFVDDTVIKGEWMHKHGDAFFLVHSWENNVREERIEE